MLCSRLMLYLGLPALAGTLLVGERLVWQERAPLPQPRAGYMAGVIDGQMVIAGGSYWENNKKIWTARVDLFDPKANVWHSGAPLPESRSDGASVIYRDALYVFGGGADDKARRDALMYYRGKWSLVAAAELPEPRISAVAVECRQSIYLVGGMSDGSDDTTMKNNLWVWDPKSAPGGWKALAPFPGPGLIAHAVAAMNEKIYVFGGATTSENGMVNSDDAYEFDTRRGAWSKLPKLPIARRAWSAVALTNRVLLLGGYTSNYEKDVFEYDVISGDLEPAGTLPHGVCDARFVRIGRWVIGAGGEAADKIRGQWTFQTEVR